MKTQVETLSERIKTIAVAAIILPAAIFLLLAKTSYAASATWVASPVNGDWNTAANWTAGGPPNGSGDIATFGTSNQTALSFSANITTSAINYSPGASAFNLTISPPVSLTISGPGITNNSGITQTFIAGGYTGDILFANSASAGSLTSFSGIGSSVVNGFGGGVQFIQNSTADHGLFSTSGGMVSGAFGGFVGFYDNASADHATVNNSGAAVTGATGGETDFFPVRRLITAFSPTTAGSTKRPGGLPISTTTRARVREPSSTTETTSFRCTAEDIV